MHLLDSKHRGMIYSCNTDWGFGFSPLTYFLTAIALISLPIKPPYVSKHSLMLYILFYSNYTIDNIGLKSLEKYCMDMPIAVSRNKYR